MPGSWAFEALLLIDPIHTEGFSGAGVQVQMLFERVSFVA